MKTKRNNRLVLSGIRRKLRLHPPCHGCRFDGPLRLYRLSEYERERLGVAQDNPGIVAVVG